jgi:hypothetical protein
MKVVLLLTVSFLIAALVGISNAKAEGASVSTSDISPTTADSAQEQKLSKKIIRQTKTAIKVEKAQPAGATANESTMTTKSSSEKIAPSREDDSYSGSSTSSSALPNSKLGRPSVGPSSESESTVSPTNTDINDNTRNPGK